MKYHLTAETLIECAIATSSIPWQASNILDCIRPSNNHNACYVTEAFRKQVWSRFWSYLHQTRKVSLSAEQAQINYLVMGWRFLPLWRIGCPLVAATCIRAPCPTADPCSRFPAEGRRPFARSRCRQQEAGGALQNRLLHATALSGQKREQRPDRSAPRDRLENERKELCISIITLWHVFHVLCVCFCIKS